MTQHELREQAIRMEGFKEGYIAALQWMANEEVRKAKEAEELKKEVALAPVTEG